MSKLKNKEFRIKLVDRDGSIVQNRKIISEWLFFNGSNPDDAVIRNTLNYDCRVKGVKLISYKSDRTTGITAVVDYLGKI